VSSFPRQAKSIRLSQATVLAGYVPSDEELHELQLEAARDRSPVHQIQQLVNWLDEDRQQVPSLQRQCRVVIRRQLSVAGHFQSILPAIDRLPLPTILKLYLQFDGPLSEVDLNVLIDSRSRSGSTSDASGGGKGPATTSSSNPAPGERFPSGGDAVTDSVEWDISSDSSGDSVMVAELSDTDSIAEG